MPKLEVIRLFALQKKKNAINTLVSLSEDLLGLESALGQLKIKSESCKGAIDNNEIKRGGYSGSELQCHQFYRSSLIHELLDISLQQRKTESQKKYLLKTRDSLFDKISVCNSMADYIIGREIVSEMYELISRDIIEAEK